MTNPAAHEEQSTSPPSMLEGPALPILLAAALAGGLGLGAGLLAPERLAPLGFTASSVLCVGLLGAARRTDTASRPDHAPESSLRTLLAMGAVLALAVVGTSISAWHVAGSLLR